MDDVTRLDSPGDRGNLTGFPPFSFLFPFLLFPSATGPFAINSAIYIYMCDYCFMNTFNQAQVQTHNCMGGFQENIYSSSINMSIKYKSGMVLDNVYEIHLFTITMTLSFLYFRVSLINTIWRVVAVKVWLRFLSGKYFSI